MKTSSEDENERRLQDVFKISSRRLQDVFIKTNVCWGYSVPKNFWLVLIDFDANLVNMEIYLIGFAKTLTGIADIE